MDELEQALNVTTLTSDDHVISDDDHIMSDGDKKLMQHSIGLIKVVTSYNIIDHVILFRSVPNV